MKAKKLLTTLGMTAMLMCLPQQVSADSSLELKNTNGTLVLYENNKATTDKSGFIEVDGITYFISNGKVLNVNGLFQDPKNVSDWYYLAEGRVQTQHTGLVLYDGAWFYVENGKLDTTTAGFIPYDGSLFYVGLGRIMTEVSGLAQDPNGSDWYYLANGQAQTQYTGLALYDNEWFYVINGKLAQDYTGTVAYNGSEFYVVNGMINNDSNVGNSNTGTETPNPDTPNPVPDTQTPNPDVQQKLVWIDNTANRYHKQNGCGMDNAYQVTLDEAVALGKTPCGRCY